MGGASTQITFETQKRIEDPQSGVTLRLYGQTYRVYTHSFLCYGRDQILRRMFSKVMKVRRPGSAPAGSPQWPAGRAPSIHPRSLLNHQPPTPCSHPGCYTQGSGFRSPGALQRAGRVLAPLWSMFCSSPPDPHVPTTWSSSSELQLVSGEPRLSLLQPMLRGLEFPTEQGGLSRVPPMGATAA